MSTENLNIEMLFKCYYRPMCLYAIHYIGNIDDAEDVVQESFLKFWNDCQNQSNIKNTKSYLYRIVRNKSIDKLREYKANIKETDYKCLNEYS
jgi:RNA polymerase sigma-70 factor (ECF subfamily)